MRLGKLQDLESAIDYARQAVLLTPQGDLLMPFFLGSLGNLLNDRFQHLGEMDDLKSSIEHQKQLVLLLPVGHSSLPKSLSSLGAALSSRFDRLGEPVSLDEAIVYMTQAVQLTPKDHPSLSTYINNISILLSNRFEHRRDPLDLDKSVDFAFQAISLTPQGHPAMSGRLNSLGGSLHCRFKHLEHLSDIEEAVAHMIRAISLLPQSHPDMPNWLHNLGCVFQSRFDRLGEISDLNNAIEYKSQAIELTPHGHPQLRIWIGALATSLQHRFGCSGKIADLDDAIDRYGQAISLTSENSPQLQVALSNLSVSLRLRFERLGEPTDLDKAIGFIRRAISLTPQGHQDIPLELDILAMLLAHQFDQLGDPSALNKAIQLSGEVISLLPHGHLKLGSALDNLGILLSKRFEYIGDLLDLERSIEHHTQAVSLTPQNHRRMPTYLSNLGCSMGRRFGEYGKLVDLDTSVEYLRQAISQTRANHPDMPGRLNNLGFTLYSRFRLLDKQEYLDEAIDCFQRAAESLPSSPFHRFRPALQWARMCAEHRTSSLLQAYRQTMALLPQIVWLGNAVHNRYKNITDVGSVTTEASAAAIKVGDFPLALEWLEQGRSIVWKQMLQLRTPVDDLHAVSPELADELKQVARDLDYASLPKPMADDNLADTLALENLAQQHRRLADRWEELIDEVRRLPSFEAFLLPQKTSELARSAHSGPVVVINLHKTSCDALVIQPGSTDITHIPLSFSHEKATKAHAQLVRFARGRSLTARGIRVGMAEPQDDFVRMLSMLWTQVVMPVLDCLGYMQRPPTGDLPHITWCPTGPLSFLPIHAAGDYIDERMVFNYVVSSYTPTLSALLSPPPSATFTGILAVGQEITPDMPSLPGTVAELTRIQEKCEELDFTRLDGGCATLAAVLAGMEEHSWVHLACHATQNTTDPLRSAFYLHDGMLNLASITQKSLKHAELAFLSACQTATGDESLSEEAVHLAAGMLMAEYRTVIATMWSIGDEDAPLVAAKVYEHLLEEGKPDARRAALAVHEATKHLRAKVGVKDFGKWVPYVHIGL